MPWSGQLFNGTGGSLGCLSCHSAQTATVRLRHQRMTTVRKSDGP